MHCNNRRAGRLAQNEDGMNATGGEAVAVIGSGGIGGYIASELHDAGREVRLCVRTPFDALEVTDGRGTRTVPVAIMTEPSTLGPVPWAFLTTKS